LGRYCLLLSSGQQSESGNGDNKIRVLQRRAYGYRDEEFLKLKIVAAFLPPLPRNANINPHDSA
jgi:hypothetical protein